MFKLHFGSSSIDEAKKKAEVLNAEIKEFEVVEMFGQLDHAEKKYVKTNEFDIKKEKIDFNKLLNGAA
ncbi:MAG: hypothetical protein N4A47_07305 [Clostridia bacterium]|jgi:hypothetical protein|nr:hypothetical protein [Clostridia bacterium]